MNAAGATLVPAAEQLPSWLLALEDKLGTYLAPGVVGRVGGAYRQGAPPHEGRDTLFYVRRGPAAGGAATAGRRKHNDTDYRTDHDGKYRQPDLPGNLFTR